MHGGDGEVTLGELLSKPVNLSAGVAENDSLGDGDGFVQVGKSVELPILLLNSNVKLLDTFEGQLGLLDQDADGVAHELGGDLQNVLRHGGREKDDLGGLGKELEDVVDLLGETTLETKISVLPEKLSRRPKEFTHRQHLIGLVEDKELDRVGLQSATLDHVVDTAGGSNNNVDTILENLHVITDDSSSNTGMAFNVHEVTDGDDDLLDLLSKLTRRSQDQSLALLKVQVDLLENGDREGGSFSGSGLCLSDNIAVWCESLLEW